MGVEWTERLTNVVLPALVDGISIYTGSGELRPGQGVPQGSGSTLKVQDATTRKPLGLPVWQVYLGAKADQPALRFLQLIHKVRNPVGSASMVYPTRHRDEKLGVPLILPLGEGHETPGYELHVANDFAATAMYKPVKVIALGRVRFFTTTSPWSFSEPIVMEIFSESGALIWSNPFIGMTLEEAIERLKCGDLFQVQVRVPVRNVNPAHLKRQEVEVEIRNLFGQGLHDDEIKSYLEQVHGMDPMVAHRLANDFRYRKECSLEVQTHVRYCAEQFAAFYEGDELLQAVVDESGQGMDVVINILRNTSSRL